MSLADKPPARVLVNNVPRVKGRVQYNQVGARAAALQTVTVM